MRKRLSRKSPTVLQYFCPSAGGEAAVCGGFWAVGVAVSWHASTEVEVAPAGALFHPPLRGFPLGVALSVVALGVVALGVEGGVAGSGGLGGSGGKRVGASAGGAAMAGSRGRKRAGPKSALTRKVGGRLYTRHPGEEVAGRWGRWILVHVPGWSRGGYQSYKLFLDRKAERRRVWHISVRDGLPYGGVFITHLAANHPDALQWAVNQMGRHEYGIQSEGEGEAPQSASGPACADTAGSSAVAGQLRTVPVRDRID